MHRREFLEAATAATAATISRTRVWARERAVSSAQQTQPVDGFDPWIEIRADHLAWNVSQIATRVEDRPILAVLKNNAYGLGLNRVGRLLDPLSAISGFAVVKLQEAITLRGSGVRKPILLMGPVGQNEWIDLVEHAITPMIYTPAYRPLRALAAKRLQPIGVQVCVDTGIGRVGIPYHQALAFLKEVAAAKELRIDGIMMTFAEDPDFDQEQLRRFKALLDEARKAGIRWERSHAASSFALFQHRTSFLDQVRPGMAIYGVYSEAEFRSSRVMDLRPAVALRSRVAYVKQLRAGDSAGYNRAFKPERPVWLATLPVGHTDGWPRVAAKGAQVRIGDRLYPVVGTVSASHTLVVLGAETDVRIGDVATMYDWQEGSRPEDVAAACGASVYDLTMHLNPLLPRHEL